MLVCKRMLKWSGGCNGLSATVDDMRPAHCLVKTCSAYFAAQLASVEMLSI